MIPEGPPSFLESPESFRSRSSVAFSFSLSLAGRGEKIPPSSSRVFLHLPCSSRVPQCCLLIVYV
jgi:hypothetical protein